MVGFLIVYISTEERELESQLSGSWLLSKQKLFLSLFAKICSESNLE